MRLERSAPWILDFDIENRPLTYLGSDFTTSEITAIAAGFAYLGEIGCVLLGREEPIDMLKWFATLYDAADIVTGHFIRKHDLPIINGAMLEYGLPPLKPKTSCDTKLDLRVASGVSKSQESLSAMLGLEAPKVHMTQADWREANRLTPEGLAKTEARVVGDVKQHMQLRLALAKRGMLKPMKVWRP